MFFGYIHHYPSSTPPFLATPPLPFPSRFFLLPTSTPYLHHYLCPYRLPHLYSDHHCPQSAFPPFTLWTHLVFLSYSTMVVQPPCDLSWGTGRTPTNFGVASITDYPLDVASDTFQWPIGNRDSYLHVKLSISIVLAACLIVLQCDTSQSKDKHTLQPDIGYTWWLFCGTCRRLAPCLSKPYNTPNWAWTYSSTQESEPFYGVLREAIL